MSRNGIAFAPSAMRFAFTLVVRHAPCVLRIRQRSADRKIAPHRFPGSRHCFR